MATFYDLDRANARLAELRPLLETLQAQRLELIRLREAAVGVHEAQGGREREGGGSADPEARRLELRMQALIDQMQAAVSRLDEWSIQLRDIESGLIDFPALVAGRQVWLCWRLGEEQVDWWHELSAGVAGRQRLEDLA
ncbi:MAG TPA: DUF2203 domain-containing protein [Candidatus Limnocylindrales bacterium]